MSDIKIGDMVPAFTSVTHEGTTFTLDNLKGSPTVLYFYPKDNTSGCTLEAKSLRDGKEELKRRGYKIIGVSPDSVKSHQGFCAKHELNFTLLSDADHSLSEAMGVWRLKKMCGREYMGIVRTTFVIGADGRVERVITKVDTKNAAKQILNTL